MGPEVGGIQVILSFLPLLLATVPFAIVSFVIAKRKGKEPFIFAIIALVPVINFAVILYLVSLPDREVHDRLDRIEKLLQKHGT